MPFTDMADAGTELSGAVAAPSVQHLRQTLLWPLRLMPTTQPRHARRGPWQVLRDLGDASPWREEIDEYTGTSDRFHERHYNEFVSFLPYVQRFLYGDGRKGRAAAGANGGDSPRSRKTCHGPRRAWRGWVVGIRRRGHRRVWRRC